MNESELLAFYIANHKFDGFNEDIFIKNVCHKFRLDAKIYDLYQCAGIVVTYLGALRPDREQIKPEFPEGLEINYNTVLSTCEKVTSTRDTYLLCNELALWCKNNNVDFYADFSEMSLKDILYKYVSDMLRRDKINWNKPDVISLRNFQRHDDLYNDIVEEYIREIHDCTSGRVVDLAVGVIKKNLKYVPEDLKPTSNIILDWEELGRICLTAHKVWKEFDFTRFLSICEMVLGNKNTEKSVYWYTEFEYTVIPTVAYYFSSKYFYEDYLIDKKKFRV